jgi:hypothetical protein
MRDTLARQPFTAFLEQETSLLNITSLGFAFCPVDQKEAVAGTHAMNMPNQTARFVTVNKASSPKG